VSIISNFLLYLNEKRLIFSLWLSTLLRKRKRVASHKKAQNKVKGKLTAKCYLQQLKGGVQPHRCDKRLQRLQKNLCKRVYYFVDVYLNKNHMSETKQFYDSDKDN